MPKEQHALVKDLSASDGQQTAPVRRSDAEAQAHTFCRIQPLEARSLQGNRINLLPTSHGLKFRLLDKQPQGTIDQMITRTEAGDTSVQAAAPELTEDSDAQCQLLKDSQGASNSP
ncbi:hypothetical protein [Synechococcus sp. BIOS-E4-1]|uniref:hypothetical protein n=1 Tax=Synechococcus sp. BIOS-E4-1 TaxID=1400864 RepID=UPI00164559F5|nr:hypothetical protein [Synechococcus sp. BIOS-E4-1]